MRLSFYCRPLLILYFFLLIACDSGSDVLRPGDGDGGTGTGGDTGGSTGGGDTGSGSPTDTGNPGGSTDNGGDPGTGAPTGSPVALNGRLRVQGAQLVNRNNYPIQLRGMSTHGLQWYANCVTATSMDVLANEWGADIIRLAMYVREGGYLTDPTKFTAMVDQYIDMALERGMYALVDWHQLTPGDPNADINDAKVFFDHISRTHGHKGHVLYDICNEPNGDAVTWNVIRNYANEVIPVIRANDPDSVIIVGTPRWASEPNMVMGNELSFSNVMYTMHFYAASHLWNGPSWEGQASRNLQMAVDAGIPVFVTEFGTQEATGDGPNNFVSAAGWLDYLATHRISWVNWNFSDDFRSGAVWTANTCRSGNFGSDRLKDAGTWIRNRISNPSDDFGN